MIIRYEPVCGASSSVGVCSTLFSVKQVVVGHSVYPGIVDGDLQVDLIQIFLKKLLQVWGRKQKHCLYQVAWLLMLYDQAACEVRRHIFKHYLGQNESGLKAM